MIDAGGGAVSGYAVNASLPVWQDFPARLPPRPMATDAFDQGVFWRPKDEALQRKYIEINPFGRVAWLCFDLDQEDAYEAWRRARVPEPTAFVQNRHNGRGHALYALAAPLGTVGLSNEKPIAFAASVQRGLTRRLKADPAFANRFTKNPRHPDFRTSWLATYPYQLTHLRAWLDDDDVRMPIMSEQMGLGRNCQLFESVRRSAYSSVRAFKSRGAALVEFHANVYREAMIHNADFSSPLNRSEVRAIARSVARWTWKHLNEDKFRENQSWRGRRSAEVRWEGHQSLDSLKPWLAEGFSRRTWFRRKKLAPSVAL